MKPKFSIVTITYNRAHLIGKTIQSVINQSYIDFEQIIIDDGSTDNTEEVVLSFKDKRIKYYKYAKNDTRSYLRNEGIRKAKGKYISILDSDDIWRVDKLELLNNVFNNNKEAVFIIHNVSIVENDIQIKKGYAEFKTSFYENILPYLFSDKILFLPIYTFKKSLMEQLGFFDENMIDAQHDFYLRVAVKFKVYFLAKNLTYMTKHTQNISNNFRLSAFTNYIISLSKLKRGGYISIFTFYRVKSFIYIKLGLSYKKMKNDKEAKKYFLKSFLAYPISYLGLKSIYYLSINPKNNN